MCPSSGFSVNSLFEDAKVQEFLIAAGNASSGGGIPGANCVSTITSWAVSVPLVTDPLKSWCVDSQGASREVTPNNDFGFSSSDCR